MKFQTYFDKHGSKKDKYQILFETDTGVFAPTGARFKGSNEAACILQEIVKLFSSINATKVSYL